MPPCSWERRPAKSTPRAWRLCLYTGYACRFRVLHWGEVGNISSYSISKISDIISFIIKFSIIPFLLNFLTNQVYSFKIPLSRGVLCFQEPYLVKDCESSENSAERLKATWANCSWSKKSQISELEQGNVSTTPEKIVIICTHYHVSADYLLGLTDDPEPRWSGE